MYYTIIILAFLVWIIGTCGQNITIKEFPSTFLFGVGTSAYQIEGAWNTSGKGENIWDRFTHQYPDKILDRRNGNEACNSYYKIKEDVALIKNLGVDFYRFSLSWSRILPTGFASRINSDGIRYYNELIDELLRNDIKPMVTLFHFDTPQNIQELGGFSNSLAIHYFEEFSNVAFSHFGDRVKLWTTFNEPNNFCVLMNGGIFTQASVTGIQEYLCAYNVIKAHARVYHLYTDNFKPSQNGRISINLGLTWYKPASASKDDVEAAERMLQFECGLYGNPIFHKDGDFPKAVKEYVGSRSKAEGFLKSRLPTFTTDEIDYVKGTYDFMCLNHYTTRLISDSASAPIGDPSYDKDVNVVISSDPSWASGSVGWDQKVVPWGFRKVLNWLKTTYDDPQIYVTENGFSDLGEKDDKDRINYLTSYLSEMLDAIHEDGVKVVAYTAWSLMDNFEWIDGYVTRFGLYHVDHSHPDTPRTLKSSAVFYKDVVENKRLFVKN